MPDLIDVGDRAVMDCKLTVTAGGSIFEFNTLEFPQGDPVTTGMRPERTTFRPALWRGHTEGSDPSGRANRAAL